MEHGSHAIRVNMGPGDGMTTDRSEYLIFQGVVKKKRLFKKSFRECI